MFVCLLTTCLGFPFLLCCQPAEDVTRELACSQSVQGGQLTEVWSPGDGQRGFGMVSHVWWEQVLLLSLLGDYGLGGAGAWWLAVPGSLFSAS